MKLETIIQNEVSQKEKDKYRFLTHIYGIQKNGTEKFICRAAKEKQTKENEHGERGGEGEMHRESNMETFITVYKIDSQWEFAVGSGIPKRGSVSTQRSWMGWEMGGRFKRAGIYVYLWLIHVEV